MTGKMPHKAVCLLTIEVHSLLPSGECSGRLVSAAELKEYGLKPKMVISVSGFDKQDCLKKLKEVIDGCSK